MLLYFLHAKIKGKAFAIVHKSQEESYSKKIQHHLSFLNKEGNPFKNPLFCSANWNHNLSVDEK